jgi:hypothetical protein
MPAHIALSTFSVFMEVTQLAMGSCSGSMFAVCGLMIARSAFSCPPATAKGTWLSFGFFIVPYLSLRDYSHDLP